MNHLFSSKLKEKTEDVNGYKCPDGCETTCLGGCYTGCKGGCIGSCKGNGES